MTLLSAEKTDSGNPSAAASELLKAAVVGLQANPGYEEHLGSDVKNVLAQKSYDNAAQRFLDAATLTVMQAELSRIPKPDQFDELPPIADDSRPQPSRTLSAVLENLIREAPRATRHLLALLEQKSVALPDALFAEILQHGSIDNALASQLLAVAGTRSLWALRLHTPWQAAVRFSPDNAAPSVADLLDLQQTPANEETAHHHESVVQAFSDASSYEQQRLLRQLSQQPDGARSAFCRSVWSHCKAETRLLLLAYLRDDLISEPADVTINWLQQSRNDKSVPVKREIQRMLAGRGDTDYLPLLKQYLQHGKKSLQLVPPEELTDALKQLAISDQDHLGTNVAKPVLRLGQLLTLTGPHAWATALACSSSDAMAHLAGSRFKKELEPFLLEAALYHRDAQALQRWCAHYPNPSAATANALPRIAARIGPTFLQAAIVTLLHCNHTGLLLMPALWQQMLEYDVRLTVAQSRQFWQLWCDDMLQQQRYLDADIMSVLMRLLDLGQEPLPRDSHWQKLQAGERMPVSKPELLEQLFEFRRLLMAETSHTSR